MTWDVQFRFVIRILSKRIALTLQIALFLVFISGRWLFEGTIDLS